MALLPRNNKGSLINLTNTGSFKKQVDNPYPNANLNLNPYYNTHNVNEIKKINTNYVNEDLNSLGRELFPLIEEGKELKSKNFNLNYFNWLHVQVSTKKYS